MTDVSVPLGCSFPKEVLTYSNLITEKDLHFLRNDMYIYTVNKRINTLKNSFPR